MNSKNSKPSTGVLSNGLRYIYNHQPNSSSIAILILVRYGAGFDEKSGIAHLLEHILFKGTHKRPNTKEIMAEFNSVGTRFNAYTSKTFTGYHCKAAYPYLELNLDLLSDLVVNTNFYTPEFLNELEKEKQIVVEELKAIKDSNKDSMFECIERNIYKGKLGFSAQNDIEAIKSITLDDIIKTYKKYYVGSNIIVSVNGNLGKNKDKLPKMLETYLSGLPRGTPNLETFDYRFLNSPATNLNIISKPEITKALVSLTYLDEGYKNREKYYMMELFRLVFIDLTSGRLFQEIREKKGLIYSIRSGHSLYDYLGYLTIVTSTEKNKLKDLLTEIKIHIDRMKTTGLTKKEFEIAKNNYTSKLLLELDNSMTLAEYNAYELFYEHDRFMNYSDIEQLIRSFTLEKMNIFIKDLISKEPIITIVEPK
jgi:predicted Zn-dependent peptidase